MELGIPPSFLTLLSLNPWSDLHHSFVNIFFIMRWVAHRTPIVQNNGSFFVHPFWPKIKVFVNFNRLGPIVFALALTTHNYVILLHMDYRDIHFKPICWSQGTSNISVETQLYLFTITIIAHSGNLPPVGISHLQPKARLPTGRNLLSNGLR